MWSSFPGMHTMYSLTALGWVSSVAAYYYVDNANNTVAYAATGTSWRTFSFATRNLTLVLSNGNFTVDSSKCYDENYALAACAVENNCHITFPFTGSGVSVYVMHAGFQGVAARLTIDGGQSVTATLPPPTPPSYQTPNVSLFDLQSLPSTGHTATIDILGWDDGTTSLYFDYALINESHIELPVSPSTSSPSFSLSMTSPAIHSVTSAILQSLTTQPVTASSTSPEASSGSVGPAYTSAAASTLSNTGSRVNLAAVVGGACGGLAALIVIVTAVIFLKKHKSRHVKLAESRRPDPFPATSTLSPEQIASSPARPSANEKARMHLASRHAEVYQPRRQSDGNSDIPSAPGNRGRALNAVAGPSTVDPFSCDDFVIDCRRENTSIPTAPPGYRTVEGSITSSSTL